MVNKRVKISTVVESQLPSYVRASYPLAAEFLEEYYKSQDSQSLPANIVNNIDQYVKVDNLTNLVTQASLGSSISFFDTTIKTDSTEGFPSQYGVIQIDSEIITYTGITTNSFTGCVRGFSGITSYRAPNTSDELVFSSTDTAEHSNGSTIKNLSILFLQEFLKKLKRQILPGFEDRKLYEGLDQRLFLKEADSFYVSKGTEQSYEILFRALYGKDVELIRPSDYLFIPSDARYQLVNNLVVEAVDGDPELLFNKTLFQDADQYNKRASGSISKVEKIERGEKTYYTISLDSDYNKDIDVEGGSIKGVFVVNPKTELLDSVSIGATVLDVDSTVGFAATGEIFAVLPNGTSQVLEYLSKSTNQFFDVSGVTQAMSDDQELRQNFVAYGYTSSAQVDPVQVRIGAVLKELVIPEDAYYTNKGDKIQIKTLGDSDQRKKATVWQYNHKTTFTVESIIAQGAALTYDVKTFDDNGIVLGDTITLIDNTSTSTTFIVDQIKTPNTFVVSGSTLDSSKFYTVTRSISKGDSTNYPYISNFITNVQNTYLNNDDVYVASNSIPYYPNQSLAPEDYSVSFSGTFSGENLNIGSHPFVTGDAVNLIGDGFSRAVGVYFVKVVDNTTVKLAVSRPNVSTNNFVEIKGSSTNARLVKFGYKGKSLQPQGLLRKIVDPVNDGEVVDIKSTPVGMLVNGVEVGSYKSEDTVSFGSIDNVEVIAEGEGYDIINPPVLGISDNIGLAATGSVSVKGELVRIDLVDPGSDYLEVPTVTITGGNGTGAKAEATLAEFIHDVTFNSIASANQVDLPLNTIAIGNSHKFRDGEHVFYETNGLTPIGGLESNSEYYIGVVDAFRVKLYKTQTDAVTGKDAIDLTSYGVGGHTLRTVDFRKKVGSVRVIDSGKNYENKLRKVATTGINTASNLINIRDHGYNSGDIVTYETSGNEILGLSTAQSYYVTSYDNNQFYLSEIGIGSTIRAQYYAAREYVDLRSQGSGTHEFNYEPIEVKIEGIVGLTTVTTTESIIVDSRTIRSGIVTVDATVGQTDFVFGYPVRPSNPQLLDVFMDGVRLNDTDYDAASGTQIVLQSAANGGEIVEMVSYASSVRTQYTEVTAGAGQTNYPFIYSPGNLDVVLNGVKLPLRDYESDTGTTVILNQGAIAGDSVELIGYPDVIRKETTITAQQGQTKFTFPHQTEYSLIDVYLNGAKLPVEDYDATNQSFVEIYSPTTAGDVVYLSYFVLSELVFLGTNFNATVQPIFRGNIETVSLSNNGSGYGSNSIINYNRQPLFTLNSGKEAEVIPVIDQTTGGIQDVLIKNTGSGYNAPPNLLIAGGGLGAIFTTIIKNGALTEIIVISPGRGYNQSNTTVRVVASGLGAKFNANIKTWTLNEVQKLIERSKISADDGVLYKQTSGSLEYTHLYAPRELRRQVYGTKFVNGANVFLPDIAFDTSGKEVDNTNHSPIIGWAYDGNPIYGPYGFDTPSGGTVRRMFSSYVKDLKPGRPPLAHFPFGMFIEDFSFDNSGDLDEHNGRFCITPEFPKGTYAYFMTVSENFAQSGPFKNFKTPVFPYVVGQSFKSSPILFNFHSTSNQSNIDINSNGWFRNTDPYKLESDFADYQYLFNPNKVRKQVSVVRYSQPGGIDNIDIYQDGRDFRVGDSINFSGGTGRGAFGKISRVTGKTVTSIANSTTYIESIEFVSLDNTGRFIGIAPEPHGLNNLDIVSVTGLSTFRTDLRENTQIRLPDAALSLTAGISTVSVTGFVTHFSLASIPQYPLILENDILKVDNEQVKVLNVDHNKSSVRVLRAQNSTAGFPHTVTSPIVQESRRVQVSTNFKKSDSSRLDRQLYFEPETTVGLGATWGVGITSILFLGQVNHKSPVSFETGGNTILLFQRPQDISNFIGGGYVSIVNPTTVGFAVKNAKVLSVGSTSITVDFDTSALAGAGVTGFLNSVVTQEIPTRSLFIENHGLETGDKVSYNSNGGTSLTVKRDTAVDTALVQDQELFIKRIDNNIISIAQTASDLNLDKGILQFVGLGTDVYHSFKTVRSDVIIGQIEKNNVTVSTASTHELSLRDRVSINLNVGIDQTFKVVYNDYNRRTLINPKEFTASDVVVARDTIRIDRHKFKNGEKVIFTGTTGQLENDRIYYVVVFDNNNIRLSNTYFDATSSLPIFINFSTTFSGSIAPVNPQISYCANQKVIFDLSDSSLAFNLSGSPESSFNFDLYTDPTLTNSYLTSEDLGSFNIKKTGVIGISTDAKLEFKTTASSPDVVFYALTPVPDGSGPTKNTIIRDDDKIVNPNALIRLATHYAGEHVVTSIAATSFTYTIADRPKFSVQTPDQSIISYDTESITATGGISSIRTTSGSGYLSLPEISNIVSAAGTETVLNGISTSIGKLKTVDIQDIGFDYPSDNSVRPTVRISNILDIGRYFSFARIGISSAGEGYTNPADLVVLDGITNQKLDGVELSYELGETEVRIVQNTRDLYNVDPIIIPINNSNGVGINTIKYNTSNSEVTAVLVGSFGTVGGFPFNVGDEIFVEGVATLGTNVKGFNSEDYTYAFFKVTEIKPQYGGVNAEIKYNLGDYLKSGDVVGSFDPTNSSARAIPRKNMPSFQTTLEQNDFLNGETIIGDNGTTGVVDRWDPIASHLNIINPTGSFVRGEDIVGQTSGTRAIIADNIVFESSYNLGSSSKVEQGWKKFTGFLNNDLSRVEDSDYYQYFSYELKSEVSLENWDEPVQSLNHPAGWKKFSNLLMVSRDQTNTGINTDQDGGDVSSVVDVISKVDTYCLYDWDLASENNLFINGVISSDEIIFNSQLIQNYFESIGNIVLSIDDVGDQFNSNQRVDDFSKVDTYPLTDRSKKYITYVKDRRFTNERQLMMVTVLQNEIQGFLNQYGRVESVSDLGSFDFAIVGRQGELRFFPVKSTINNYDISLTSYNNNDVIAGIGSTIVGSVADVYTSQTPITVGLSTFPVVSIAKTYSGAKILVSASSTDNFHQYDEITLLRDKARDVAISEYGNLTDLNLIATSTVGLGTYDATIPNKVAVTINTSTYANFSGIITTTGGSGSGPFGGFNIGDHTRLTGDGQRQLTIGPVDARVFDDVNVFAIVGNDSNGGEAPEVSDGISLRYSIDGGLNYINSGIIVPYNGAGSLSTHTKLIPDAAKTSSTLFRFQQNANSGNDFDTYGFKNIRFNSERMILNFYPHAGIAGTVNALTIGLGITEATGIGSMTFNTNTVETLRTNISASATPSATRIAGWSSDNFNGGYLLVGVTDSTNDEQEIFELMAVQDDLDQFTSEFGNVMTNSGLGTVGIACTDTTVKILYTPNANIDVDVKVYQHSMRLVDNFNDDTGIGFSNGSINSGFGDYIGTELDITRAFELKHKTKDIFHRYFAPTTDPRAAAPVDNGVVNVTANSITLAEHFFVTGEKVNYSLPTALPTFGAFKPIGIVTTNIPGVGTTDILPENLYIIKIDDKTVKVAVAASDALAIPSRPIEFASTGIGVSHRLVSTKQNQRVVMAIDNIIQSPIVKTIPATTTSTSVSTFDDIINFSIIDDYKAGDLVQIDDEIMFIDTVNETTKKVGVRRAWMGTTISTHITNAVIEKVVGNYNIVGNTVNFVSAPYGKDPIGTSSNEPDDRYWVGITTRSTFSGRSFMKSGSPNGNVDTYHDNYVLNDLTPQFTGLGTEFTLSTGTASSLTGISTNNGIVLLDGIFQSPTKFSAQSIIQNQYMEETVGITSIFFNGSPIGGEITSIGSTYGNGYQALVAAGGTAVVTATGTIGSIAIGLTGSGYRSGLQTVNVSLATSTVGLSTLTPVGIASVLNGNVVSVQITNPGSGYTSSNPPEVVFDAPFSYENLALDYVSGTSGIGTGAVASIVVGQGSSVIDGIIVNSGLGYTFGDRLTVAVGGTMGVPLNTSKTFDQFEINVIDTYSQQFSGWTLGNLVVFDKIEDKFNGFDSEFPLAIDGIRQSIIGFEGVDLDQTLLVFIDNVLQVPGEAYEFAGGSTIVFTEPPQSDDECTIIFYRGNETVDVIEKDILETVKVGDKLTLTSDNPLEREKARTVFDISSVDVVETNTYNGPGIITTRELRPVIWCKQRQDITINGQSVDKSREEYEATIFPATNVIQPVAPNDQSIYVLNARTFFDSQNENPTPPKTRTDIQIMTLDTQESAIATATIDSSGFVNGLTVTNAGVGYTMAPVVSIESPVSTGTTATATATLTGATVGSLSITNAGTGYTQAPNVLIAHPQAVVETITNVSYTGDFGEIIGISTSDVNPGEIMFDLHIPPDSYMRNTTIVGTAVTISQIIGGDYFTVYGTGVGVTTSNYNTLRIDNSVIGIVTHHSDGVYQAARTGAVDTIVAGITTTVRRVYCKISENNIDGIYDSVLGTYSWGKIDTTDRSSGREFNFYGENGVTGIETSAFVRRVLPLENKNYIV
jgi:hypothetical protein